VFEKARAIADEQGIPDRYRVPVHGVLIAPGGVWHFSLKEIHCEHCLGMEKKGRDGKTETTYYQDGGLSSFGAGGIFFRPGQIIMAGEYAEVSFNAAAYNGIGGVRVHAGSYFEMSGKHAKINGNHGYIVGGLYLNGYDGSTTGVMSGESAEMSYNVGPTASVGGVDLLCAQFTMSGAIAHISNNAGGYWAGGVRAGSKSVFTMTSGEIFGNKAPGFAQTITGAPPAV
jgi:hypothetical protein